MDPFISNEWKELEWFLERAYLFTIFGYSAPKSDLEAIDLLKGCWGRNPLKDVAQISITNTAEREELEASWNKFFVEESLWYP